MTANSLLKNLLHCKGAVVDTFDFGENSLGEPSLVAHVHVRKGERWRCPVCGRKCHVHDYVCDEAFWRCMDFRPVETRIGAKWITECVEAHCPNADRCVDPFHVVEWANDAVDTVRLDAWRRARIELADIVKKSRPEKKSGCEDPESAERIKALKKDVEMLKRSKYPLGKNPENLTAKQNERLMMVQARDRKLRRAHELKEELRLVFKLTTHGAAKEYLEKWIKSARHCRIPAFVELQRKIRRHEKHILNTIEFGLSNARIEATNNKIKLLIRIAYGFRDVDTMIGLIMLFCSSIEIPWPGRKQQKPASKGPATIQVV